jgi:hypothetical protein
VLILAVWGVCISGHALELTHDPFNKPDLLIKPPSTNAVSTADQDAVDETILPLEGELRATIQAGAYSMVNVAGEILMLGDTIEGYRLVQVGETEAIFEKNGTKKTLSLIERAPLLP